MNIDRAKRIAGSFGGSVSLSVTQLRQGLLVQYRMRSYYFTHEPRFWAYIFTLAGIPAACMNHEVRPNRQQLWQYGLRHLPVYPD